MAIPAQSMEAQAFVVVQPTAPQAFLSVLIPQGLNPGQQVAFTTPDGQRLMATTQQPVPPGGTLKVPYTPTRPTVTQGSLPAVSPAAQQAERDHNASNRSWCAFFTSLGCCACCGPLACIFAPILWVGVAANYFTKPREQRQLFPRQRTPAIFSLSMCVISCVVGTLFLCGAAGFSLGYELGKKGLPHGPHDWRNVDWERTFESCPALAKYATVCPEGPESCERPATPEEDAAIKDELSQDPCESVARHTGALEYLAWLKHHKEDSAESDESDESDDVSEDDEKNDASGENEDNENDEVTESEDKSDENGESEDSESDEDDESDEGSQSEEPTPLHEKSKKLDEKPKTFDEAIMKFKKLLEVFPKKVVENGDHHGKHLSGSIMI
eukprot:TRINITY_DN18961_c0_g1_i2.p1 TRINITY_DN18961_c0_g1~~TRINITY_DN18961_c0_g1_i2.p1  ORF type:complete len:384 (-),score=90.27 TRINITY_DN18961_c0_g1_i2:158-1309(-)